MGCKESKVVDDKVEYVDYKDVIECPPKYPPPFAPTSRKKDIFYPEKFKQAAERVKTVPQNVLTDYTALLKHLTEGVISDLEKVWIIYLWVTSHNFTDSAHGKHAAEDTPKGYLRWIFDGKGDVASFFAILCRRANIKCVIIDGISKGRDYEVGMQEHELEKMRDRWNAVYLDKNWRFVHANWGSNGSENIKSYFFLTEPEEFNTWCRPDDRQWQLLTTMVTMAEFTNFPYCTAEFFIMNMKVLSPKIGKVRSKNGHIYVEIATTRNVGKTVIIKYQLTGKKLMKPKPSLHGNTGETTQRGGGIITSRLTEIEEEREENADELAMPTAFPSDLENFVFMWRKDAHVMFDIRLPVSGSYIFSVEAGHLNPDCTISTMVIIAEFKVYSFDNIHEDDLDLFPHVPEIGWGVTPYCLVRGIRPISHVDGEVFVLPDADTIIRFELDHEYEFDIEMISANFSDNLQQYTSHSIQNNILTIKVRIPGEGQYGLKINAKGSNDTDFVNVCNYFLVFNKISSNVEKFPKRMLRERLEKCIDDGTRHGLQEALDDFVLHSVPDRGEVRKAKDKLGFFDDKKALSDAIKRKNPTYLQKAIQDAKKSRFTAELSDDIKKAEITLAKLNRMEGFLHPIAKLENSTLAEIRCYSWPPEVVRNVLAATYVLLGENYEYLQDWDFIQMLMAKVGKEGLKSKVLNLDSDSVPMSQVDLADIIIEPHKLDEAREASTGTAALYQWIKHICTERKSQQTSAASSVMSNTNKKKQLKVRYTGNQGNNTKNSNYDSTKPGQYNTKKSEKYDNGKPGQSLSNNLGQTQNGKSSKNAKAKEHKEIKAVRDTNISSQHMLPKADDKTNNIVGMKIINEHKSPSSRSPDSKKSPLQNSTGSKNVSPTQKSTSSKNVSPTQKSISSKNVTPTQKFPITNDLSPSKRSPASKYVSPVQKSPSNRSPNQKSPTQKSPTEKSPVQRFHVVKSPQKSPPPVPSDDPPHRSPLQRPPPDDFLSPRGLSPVSQSDRQPFNDYSQISPNEH